MTQNLFPSIGIAGLHVAIIMDGNGRWAQARGLSRMEGHRAGVQAVRRVVEAAPGLGIGTLTLFAFTSDNWQRPELEVDALLQLVENYLRADSRVLAEKGARLSVVGRRDRLPDSLLEAVCAAEAATANGREFHLRLAVDYSARDAVLRASSSLGAGTSVSWEAFARLLADMNHDACGPPPDCDLLIRAGGEQRLSDCLLWESPYAELIFTERMWPEFNGVDLEAALREFYSRNRRFGQVSLAAAG